jgi:hypothetical protein
MLFFIFNSNQYFSSSKTYHIKMNCTICFENTGGKKAIAKRGLVSQMAAHRREDFKKKLAQLPETPDDIGVASSSRVSTDISIGYPSCWLIMHVNRCYNFQKCARTSLPTAAISGH